MPLALASDERRLEPPGHGLVSDELDEPESFDRLCLALQQERLDRFDLDGITHEQTRLGADESLTRRCSLLEPRSDVDGVSGDERLRVAADDDLAGVDADPRVEPVLDDGRAHLGRSAHRPQRVVLVRDRDPEDRHDRVADELLDGPAVPLDDRAQVLEVAAHARTKRFGIGGLPECGRADEVAEEDGHDLALLGR